MWCFCHNMSHNVTEFILIRFNTGIDIFARYFPRRRYLTLYDVIWRIFWNLTLVEKYRHGTLHDVCQRHVMPFYVEFDKYSGKIVLYRWLGFWGTSDYALESSHTVTGSHYTSYTIVLYRWFEKPNLRYQRHDVVWQELTWNILFHVENCHEIKKPFFWEMCSPENGEGAFTPDHGCKDRNRVSDISHI